VLYSIPVIVFYGWLVLQYGKYSSLVFQTRLNYALRAELFRNMDIAWVLVIIFNGLVYLLLFVWAESVVLEGATFQGGFLRSMRFAARNPLRLIVVAAVNYISLAAMTEWVMHSAAPVLRYDEIAARYTYTQPPALPVALGFILLFILLPIMAYAHYALYIPPVPFRPVKHRGRTRRERGEVVMDDGETLMNMGDESITARADDAGERSISTRRPDFDDMVSERRPGDEKHPLLDDSDTEPDRDSLRLNE